MPLRFVVPSCLVVLPLLVLLLLLLLLLLLHCCPVVGSRTMAQVRCDVLVLLVLGLLLAVAVRDVAPYIGLCVVAALH
jgi:hypothetical protein